MRVTKQPWTWWWKVYWAVALRRRTRLWELRLETMERAGDPAAVDLRQMIRVSLGGGPEPEHIYFIDMPDDDPRARTDTGT